jgi:hypothetical protein
MSGMIAMCKKTTLPPISTGAEFAQVRTVKESLTYQRGVECKAR